VTVWAQAVQILIKFHSRGRSCKNDYFSQRGN